MSLREHIVRMLRASADRLDPSEPSSLDRLLDRYEALVSGEAS